MTDTIRFDSNPCITEADLPRIEDYSEFHPFLKGVFSQWHFTPFEVDGVRFVCAEQFMMAAKASLFGDLDTAQQIMSTDDPAVQKRFGGQVKGFEQALWDKWRFDIVYRANNAKFAQNSGALRQLKNTVPAMLVESNPRDWNWGNGLQADDPANHDPSQWRGTSYLGRILTLVREQLG